jgi:hypothetical protein
VPLTITHAQLDDAARALAVVKGQPVDWAHATKTTKFKLRAEVMRLLVALGQRDFRIATHDTEDPDAR